MAQTKLHGCAAKAQTKLHGCAAKAQTKLHECLAKTQTKLHGCAGYSEPWLLHNVIRAPTCDFQQCGILTIVISDEAVQLPFKLRNSK